MRLPFSLPDGWPISLWFFVITVAVYLLQRFPLTGVFLMIVAAPFWSILLVNLGMFGLVWEGVTGRVSLLWLLIPALYFGIYYLAYFNDQKALKFVTEEIVRFNDGKSLRFDTDRQDLVFGDPKDGRGVRAANFTERFGLARVFDSHGRVYLVGTAESCELLRDKPVFRSAGIQHYAITRRGPSTWNRKSTGFCTIMMAGQPDKPVVRITESAKDIKNGRLPVTQRDFTATDESNGALATVRTARASPLKVFPMPVMGCGLDSGTPSWDCFHGFLRDAVDLPPGMPQYSGGTPLLASMLGLKATEDLAAHAIGPERFKPMADRADAELAAKELRILETMLADPTVEIKNGWFRHLPNRPDLVEPYADRIFDALGTLQHSGIRGSGNGRNLWRLAALLPEEALAPHRTKMVEWMKPGAMRQWTDDSREIFSRLDITDAVQRDIVLSRLERLRGDLSTSLLPAFCKMGVDAPHDTKERLLGVWRARGARAAERKSHRGQDEVLLYLTLARMGLKEQAGKVEQRYYGPTFLAIWDQVTPNTPSDICDLSIDELRRHLR